MYNKLFSKIVNSSVWLESMPTRIVWVTLLAVMDEVGFAQFAAIGNVANTARVSLEEAQAALACLESPDAESGDPENEGRRIERVPGGWMVLNAEKHRALVTRAVTQEQTRLRVQRHRDKKRISNAGVTQSSNDGVTPSEARSEAESALHSEKDTERASAPTVPAESTQSTITKSVNRPQPIIARRRKDAAWEGGRFYVPQRIHTDFLDLRQGGPGSPIEHELLAWYEAVSIDWIPPGRRCREEPGADMFAFWRARYAERWPVATVDKRVPQWVRDVDARARQEAAE